MILSHIQVTLHPALASLTFDLTVIKQIYMIQGKLYCHSRPYMNTA